MKILFFLSLASMILAPVEAEPKAINGMYTQLCTSGRTVFIPFDRDENESETPNHKMTACHAVCADRQPKVKR